MTRRVIPILLVLSLSARVAAQPPNPERERALSLFAESHVLYGDGRYDEAAELLRVAYGIFPEPILLFNLGMALERGGDLTGAVASYRRFLEREPEAQARQELEARVVELERQVIEARRVARQAIAEPPTVPIDVPSSPGPSSASPWPWVLAGIGAAMMATGIGLGVAAEDAHARANDSEIHRDTVGFQTDAEGFAIGANLGFVLGGLALGIGVVWGIIDVVESRSR